ncbi:acetyl-coenzyme A carboxylase carboxyl transferase subunit alpha [Andreesenia angusta]|uniref:Acetyl-coenzyme A carboxylase carboxyl transferase subunit alpha n=1 Tax=Andreesenia angusta TaxID=39480 RepID=A0A1S1V536_9FIRM|nr:acetyl-CoA carboxylase carboxyltransferase subunit alpha [Andreesenia angusta]OHW61771.1 acetyl-coenzyme A carboxylase carboxyl transferase subunit alpha [Andreesenia angusta]
MSNFLDFEKPILELENKIKELEEFSRAKDVNLDDEIETLRKKSESMKNEIYSSLGPWEKVKLARHKDRPNTLEYISNIFLDFMEFHGDRQFADDKSIVGGIAMLDGEPLTVIGHQKGRDTSENISRNFGMPHPEGYRKALRLMKQAEKFGRPVVTFIDTPGAFCGLGAEERGQGEAIALNLLEMSRLSVPTIAIVIGEGGSGGALALGVGDKIAMLEHSVYSVISPEGLASILWKDSKKAQSASEVMKLTSENLKELKIIDDIIGEPLGGAHKDVCEMSRNIKSYIVESLGILRAKSIDELKAERYTKIRNMGYFEEK